MRGLVGFASRSRARARPGRADALLQRGGARTAAFVNDAASPLAQAAQWVLPLHAGDETSVAATKSFIAQLVGRRAPRRRVAGRPRAAGGAVGAAGRAVARRAADWSPRSSAGDADRLFVIGRGTGLPIALEAALKFKETCAIQAEAFSAPRSSTARWR
jgi:glucosamine--fructose-6-phosphate aminotransferase (isomerizing)